MEHFCPCCHGYDTESLPSVYRRGSGRRDAASASIGPPRKRRVVVLVVMLVLAVSAIVMRVVLLAAALPGTAATLGGGPGITGGLIFVVVIAWGLMRADRYNRTEWLAAMRRWERSFQCRNCGFVFAPGASLELLSTFRAAEENRSALLPHA